MQSLMLVFLFLTMTTFTGGLSGTTSVLPLSKTIRYCIDQMNMANANLNVVVECLMRTGNQTAFFEHTLWKVDLLLRRFHGLEFSISEDSHSYEPSPYKNIDDVLKINGSVTGYNCKRKLFVVQAIRRKLEQMYMMNGIESSLLKWPFKRKRPDIVVLKASNASVRSIPVKKGDDYPELNCLIQAAIDKFSRAIEKR